jgi:hypothetical protein
MGGKSARSLKNNAARRPRCFFWGISQIQKLRQEFCEIWNDQFHPHLDRIWVITDYVDVEIMDGDPVNLVLGAIIFSGDAR